MLWYEKSILVCHMDVRGNSMKCMNRLLNVLMILLLVSMSTSLEAVLVDFTGGYCIGGSNCTCVYIENGIEFKLSGTYDYDVAGEIIQMPIWDLSYDQDYDETLRLYLNDYMWMGSYFPNSVLISKVDGSAFDLNAFTIDSYFGSYDYNHIIIKSYDAEGNIIGSMGYPDILLDELEDVQVLLDSQFDNVYSVEISANQYYYPVYDLRLDDFYIDQELHIPVPAPGAILLAGFGTCIVARIRRCSL